MEENMQLLKKRKRSQRKLSLIVPDRLKTITENSLFFIPFAADLGFDKKNVKEFHHLETRLHTENRQDEQRSKDLWFEETFCEERSETILVFQHSYRDLRQWRSNKS